MKNAKSDAGTTFLRVLTLAAAIAVVAAIAVTVAQPAPAPTALTRQADNLFEQKHYREAAEVYEKSLEAAPRHEGWVHASRRVVVCQLRLRLFDEAIEAAKRFVERAKGTPHEARAERLTGNLYLTVPHWGTRAGGVFHRAQHMQGIRLTSHQHDKKHAIAHLERARELYAAYENDPAALATLPQNERGNWRNERIECLFDLAAACARFNIYENQPHFWHSFWAERDEFLAETAGEEDFSEMHSHHQLTRKRPIGLRVDDEGNPIFASKPDAYGEGLSDDEKILYLLAEARALDPTEEQKYSAQSYYRQAMLARTRFGMDRLNQYGGLYRVAGRQPLQEELETFNPWELGRDEALVLAGGRIRQVALPDEWNVLQLLAIVSGDHPRSGLAAEAAYASGLYYQTRQQYTDALSEYRALQERFPGTQQARNASTQIRRILQPQVRISQTGIQVNGQPAEVQVSYRNLSRVWFVAREIDLEGFFREVRASELDEARGTAHFWALGNWHGHFVNGYQRQRQRNEILEIAAKHLKGEVVRWSDEVRDDGTHRYANATLQSPLQERGAYLVYAYVKEPPAAHARERGPQALNFGDSRAVYVLNDLAIVEKETKDGKLYFISDAVGGVPLPGAKIEVLEVWTTYDRERRQSQTHKAEYRLTADKDGLAVLPPPDRRQRGRLHTMVTAPEGRLAWTGMGGWSFYRPSSMARGETAYCVTDRPVYRPEQTVRYKAWLRTRVEGEYSNVPGQNVTVVVRNPRGEEIYSVSKRTDQFGGVDGELVLDEDAPLGVYRLQVQHAGRRHVGGTNFRVEEYRKPEFEVTVEPGKDHARLGEEVKAVIRAEYYFGEPVTEGTVSYRVFREEFRHTYFFPAPWDWLYGPGYGLPWYRPAALGRGRWIRPPWWGAPATPVRELVLESTAPLNEKGEVEVSIDTSSALEQHGDLDHRYVVEAEVTDPSRRTITGQGDLVVTRQAFYAYVQADRGYVRPGEQFKVNVRCLTPGGQPVQAEGVVTVSSVVFGGPDNARIEETVLDRWTAKADENGRFSFPLRYERSGHLRIRFEAPDAWGETVVGQGHVWVCGRDFDGRLYRFSDLEIITDKRTYEPGETAHIMINTAQPDSYVLFSDEVDSNTLLSWRMIHLPRKSTVVSIPIRSTHRPNFFVEATTVRNLRVHEEARQICVPPEESVLDLTIETDKPEYKPGEEARFVLTARTPDGKPAQAQIALSVFDRSVLYIQEPYAQPIKSFFHGHVRHHSQRMNSNLVEQYSATGQVMRPFQHLHPLPETWTGVWGPNVADWRVVGMEELLEIPDDGGMHFAFGRGVMMPQMARRSMDANGMVMAEAAAAPMMADRAESAPGAPEEEMAEAHVREEFADTALWLPSLITDGDGTAEATFTMPENLTSWRINAWAMTPATRVGEAESETVTRKNLMVRLQTPRFFVEHDEVVVSANVHNYLGADKTARVSIEFPEKLLQLIPSGSAGVPPAAVEGEAAPAPQATKSVRVPAGGQTRVDWRFRVVASGEAPITVKALTDEESDAMRMTIPVLVHGLTKQVTQSGSIRPDEAVSETTVHLDVPEQMRPELTRLEIRTAPTLVNAMLDALPYCLDYPHRTTDNTVNRFFPAVLTLHTLQNMGITLQDLRGVKGRLEEVRRQHRGRELDDIYRYSAIFDDDEMQRIIREGLRRLGEMQNADGGWGWWRTPSSPHFTAYVLAALVTAQGADVAVPPDMIERGMAFLKGYEEAQMRRKDWSVHEQRAFTAYVLSLQKMRAVAPGAPEEGEEAAAPAPGPIRPMPGPGPRGMTRPGLRGQPQAPEGQAPASPDLVERLWEGRDKLNLYGKALLSMALANLGETARAETVLRNIMQYKEENPETQVAWFRTPEQGWWHWWNSDIETNATILRAIVKLQPRSETAPQLVKWLLNNRRNGYYWRSTRDTTIVLQAMSEFALATGEAKPDYTLTLDLDDGAYTKTVRVNRENFLYADGTMVLEGAAIRPGRRTLRIKKDGPGAVYYSVYLRYFSQEVPITAAGHELHVERTYFRLDRIPYTVEVEDARGRPVTEERLRFERVPLKDGDTVKSGDLVQVELRVRSDNDYTYLAFEDMKPAGFEPVDLISGPKRQEGFHTYMELRDEKAVFFANLIARGEHLLRYRLRAETPGRFHALPTVVYGMYAPELRANSDEVRLVVED